MSLSDEIFRHNADDRTAEFEEMYFFKFGRFAHPEREAARQKALKLIDGSQEMKDDFIKKLLEVDYGGKVKKLVVDQGGKLNNLAISHALNAFVAREVVKGTVKGSVDQLGRRGAVFAIEQSSGMAAAQGAHAAFHGVKLAGALGPGISAAIGQAIAEKISEKAGVTNNHLKNCISVGGSVAAGAAAGAIVGGPVGAAGGAAIGVIGWSSSKAFDAIYASGLGISGPDDNWAYIKTDRVDGDICIGTYAPSDTMYWHTYWKEYRGSKCDMFVMSAGQGKEDSFQLCVWDQHNNVVKHLDKVYFRDFIHIGKGGDGKINVGHGKGELWGNDAGAVDIHW